MAIVKHSGGGGAMERRGAKTIGTQAAKHPAEKHGAKKHAAKKHAPKKGPAKKVAGKKHAAKKQNAGNADRAAINELGRRAKGGDPDDHELSKAYHHLERAAAVISLLEGDTGGDLKALLEHGITLYRQATAKGGMDRVRCAHGLLRAAEHLGMAGLYTARSAFRVQVAPPPRTRVARHLAEMEPRLERLPKSERENGRRLESMARELLRRAGDAQHDPHLEYELTMAADGICTALEEGL